MKEKKVVLLAGFGYLSQEVARIFASHDFRIALVTRSQKDEVTTFLASLPGEGHRGYLCDLAHQDQVLRTFTQVIDDFSSITGCVFLAGMKPVRKKMLLTTEAEMVEQLYGTFLTGFNILTESAKYLKEKDRGFIVAVTTAGVIKKEAITSLGGYIPAKFALQGFMMSLQEELKQTSVDVYTVAPGFMEGDMNADFPKAFIEVMKQKSKTGGLASASSVASCIYEVITASKKDMNPDTLLVAPEYD